MIIVIPAFNEERTISPLIKKIKSLYPQAEIIVVNDASEDQTLKKALEAGAMVIDLPSRLGYWGALQAGLLYGWRRGHKIFVTIDADGQHDPEDISKLINIFDSQKKKVVIGSCPERGDFFKKIAWSIFRLTTGIKVRDLTSGFRLYSREAIQFLIDEDLLIFDNADLATLIILHQKGFEFEEVPVKIKARRTGSSKIFSSPLQIIRYMIFSMLLTLSTRRLR